jgi:amidase
MPSVVRRQFLRAALLGGAGTCLAAMDSRERVPSRAAPAPVPVPPFELEEATLADLQGYLATGRHTARSLAETYLERVESVDRSGPTLRSVIETNPDALSIADALDAERRAGKLRGPLHGIPVLIKDNIGTRDRMQTTAGSLALEGARPARDAFVAARLRQAGAVLLGKTNLSEWANFRSTRSSSGWSARGGQCRNPYALDRSPCGSSSGSGAAAAASLAAVTVGTETDGSIVCPSSNCSIVGLKPTLGLLSRSGIVPIAQSQDTAGPMCRTVRDAAILLGQLAGADPRDPATAGAPRAAVDYAAGLDRGALSGARIGVVRARVTGYSPPADRLFEAAVAALSDLGADVVDPADIPHLGDYDDAEFTVLLHEFKAGLAAYLADLEPGAPIASLAEAIDFNERHADRELAYFGQELFTMARDQGPLTDAKYRAALKRCRRLSRRQGLDAVLDGKRLDALVAPTGGPPWPIDLVNGDHFLGASSTPAAVSGYPSVSVPMGYAFGLPVGLTFIGRAWSEALLLRLAHDFEQAQVAPRRPPRFLATAELGST